MSDPGNYSYGDRHAGNGQFLNRLHRYKTLLLRRWWIVLLALALAVSVQVYRSMSAPRSFLSQGQMIIGSTINLAQGNVYSEDLNNFIGTQIALMQGALVSGRATANIQTNHPDLQPTPVEITVTILPKTSIFLLEARGREATYVKAYLDAVMEEYMAYRQEIRLGTTDRSIKALENERTQVESELALRKAELRNFQTTNVIGSIRDQADSDAKFLSNYRTELSRLEAEQSLLDALNSDPNPNLNSTSSGTGGSVVDQNQARQSIQLLEQERAEWAVTHKDTHPKMVELTDRINKQEQLLKFYSQRDQRQIRERLASLEHQITNRRAQVEDWQRRSLQTSLLLAQYEDLQGHLRRVESLQARNQSALDQLKFNVVVPNEVVSVHQRATPPRSDNDSLIKTLGIGCFIGFVLGLGVLFLLDRFDDRPISFSELQDQFEEIVLGQIPQDGSRNPKQRIKPLTPNDSRYAYAEAYRNLRSSLLFMANEGKRPRTIVVTSAIPGEGKSTVAANLAITVAQSGSRVLLVDADLRKGVSHELFQLKAEPGLANVLTERSSWQDAVQTTPIPNLTFLSRGGYPDNPGELLLSRGESFLAQCAEHFDYIVLDSAPVLAADDTASLAPKVDGVLFVIRAGYTSARLARNALDLLYQRQVNVLGLVFNSIETTHREYYYFKYPEYYQSTRKAQRS